jgi:hypothetical protein
LKFAKLVQDERRAWWLTFDNGLEVYVGRERFEERLRGWRNSIRRCWPLRLDQIAVVDLRYVNGFAVRWKAETAGSNGELGDCGKGKQSWPKKKTRTLSSDSISALRKWWSWSARSALDGDD